MKKFYTQKFSEKWIRWLKFSVERFMIRGPVYQLVLIAAVIGVISLVSGQILLWINPTEGTVGTNSWWAFLRMSDPGYLGDDNGTAKRILSTVLTILGYVLFMGSLVAIMTQSLFRRMRQLESGLTPITSKGHIVILGYTNRTPNIVGQIFSSRGRLVRFLTRKKARQPILVVLTENVSYELTEEFKSNLESQADIQKIIFRSGDLKKVDDLGRVNVENSSVVVIPAEIFSEQKINSSDVRVIKALLSIKSRAEKTGNSFPKVVLEILDHEKVALVKEIYGENLEVVSSRSLVSKMIAHNIKNPGLSLVISELMSQSYGNEIYIKDFPVFIGKTWQFVRENFSGSIPIGISSDRFTSNCLLNPEKAEIIKEGDQLVFIADSYGDIIMRKRGSGLSEQSLELSTEGLVLKKKILIMGWSKKIPYLVSELFNSEEYDFSIDIASVVSINDRKEILNRLPKKIPKEYVNNIELDYTLSDDLLNIDFDSYSNIVFMANDWFNDGSDADARTVLGVLQARKQAPQLKNLNALIELADPENERLFGGRQGETIISPILISNILANVALRCELNSVFEVLFHSQGTDLLILDAKEFGLSGTLSFEEVSNIIDSYSMIAIGVMNADAKEMDLNPQDFQQFCDIQNKKIIVIK